MKKFENSSETGKTFDAILSKVSRKDILSVNEMICVRGGDGEGDDPIILPPFPPKGTI